MSDLSVRLSGEGIEDSCGTLGFDFDVGIPFLMLIIKGFLMVFIGLRFVDPGIDLAMPGHESNGPGCGGDEFEGNLVPNSVGLFSKKPYFDTIQ